MFMVRETFNCRPGKAGQLVAKLQELGALAEDLGYAPLRVFTDVSADRFWRVVMQFEVESLNGFLEMQAHVMSDERAGSIMAGYHDLVESGRREIYKVEN